MNSRLSNNFVKALALEGQRSKGEVCCWSGQPRLSFPSSLLPTFYCCLTTSSQIPTPSQLICHLHSSLQDSNNELKESTPKVCVSAVSFLLFVVIMFRTRTCEQPLTQYLLMFYSVPLIHTLGTSKIIVKVIFNCNFLSFFHVQEADWVYILLQSRRERDQFLHVEVNKVRSKTT